MGSIGDTGGIAQLVEHLLCKQDVTGSNPVASTSLCSKRSEREGCHAVDGKAA
jgi:hypothetical protein